MNKFSDVAPLSLRLILGFGFMFHGFGKLFTADGHQAFVGMLTGIGAPLPGATAWLVGAIEFFGGVALLAGVGVQLVGAAQIIIMLVAMYTVALPAGFNFMNVIGMSESGPVFGPPGFEVNLLYIAGLVSLIVGGAGAFSLDRALAARKQRT